MASPRSPLSPSSSSSGFPSAPSPPLGPAAADAAPKNPWKNSLTNGAIDADPLPAVMGEPSWPPLSPSPERDPPRAPPLLPTPVSDSAVSLFGEGVSVIRESHPGAIEVAATANMPAVEDADVAGSSATPRKPHQRRGKPQQQYRRAQHPRSTAGVGGSGGGVGGSGGGVGGVDGSGGYLGFQHYDDGYMNNGFMNGFALPDWSSGPGFNPGWRPHPGWAPPYPPIAVGPPLHPYDINVAPTQPFWSPYPSHYNRSFHATSNGFEFHDANVYSMPSTMPSMPSTMPSMPSTMPFYPANGFLPGPAVNFPRDGHWNHQDEKIPMRHQIGEENLIHQDEKMEQRHQEKEKISNHQDKKMELQCQKGEEISNHHDKKIELQHQIGEETLDPQKIKAAVRKQIEYYFSEENMVTSYHFRCQMDSQGWVDIHTIAEFPRVRKWTQDISLVHEALQSSDIVELKGDKMRRRHGWSKYILPNESSLATSMQKMQLDEEQVQN